MKNTKIFKSAEEKSTGKKKLITMKISETSEQFYSLYFRSAWEGLTYVTQSFPILNFQTLKELERMPAEELQMLSKKLGKTPSILSENNWEYKGKSIPMFSRITLALSKSSAYNKKNMVSGMTKDLTKKKQVGFPINKMTEMFYKNYFGTIRDGLYFVIEMFPVWFNSEPKDMHLIKIIKENMQGVYLEVPEAAGNIVTDYYSGLVIKNKPIFTKACYEIIATASSRVKKSSGQLKTEMLKRGDKRTRMAPDIYKTTELFLEKNFQTSQNGATIVLDAFPHLVRQSYQVEMKVFTRDEMDFINGAMETSRKIGSKGKIMGCSAGRMVIPVVTFLLSETSHCLDSFKLLDKMKGLSPFALFCIEVGAFLKRRDYQDNLS